MEYGCSEKYGKQWVLSLSLSGYAFRCGVFRLCDISSFIGPQFLTRSVILFFFSLLHPLLQCLWMPLRSIRTCHNGIRGRWHRWTGVSVKNVSLSVATPSFQCNLEQQLEFHLITILTHVSVTYYFSVSYYFWNDSCSCGCGFSFLWLPLLHSVSRCIWVQSRRVNLERVQSFEYEQHV